MSIRKLGAGMCVAWFASLALSGPLTAHAAEPLHDQATVAILYFDYTGKDEELGVLKKGLAQMLISDLATVDRIRIVERDRLEEILAELKLGQSGKIDPQSAAKVGKLLGARYMVLGGYFDLKEALRIDARVVEVETGKIIRSTGAMGVAQDFLGVEQKVSGELAKILTSDDIKGTPVKPDGKSDDKGTPSTAPKPRDKVAPPARLKTKTAVAYAKALDAIDRKDKPAAEQALTAVLKEQPDFTLAAIDVKRLRRN
jgi:TolB-like protein